MTTVAPEPNAPSHVSEREARAVAEAARQQEWERPSFVRQLFAGRFLLDLIHPFPQPDADEMARAAPWLERLEQFMKEKGDSATPQKSRAAYPA